MSEADRLFEEAARRLKGHCVPRDLPGARDLFRRAGEAGSHDAAVIHANFVANGTGGPPDWSGGIAVLRALAERDSRCRRELEIIDSMALTPEGDPLAPPAGEVLSETPRVTLFRRLFSAAECSYLATAARPMLEPAVVIDSATGRQRPDPVRRADSVGFTWPLENPAVHALNRRLASASRTHVEQGEPLQVLRYRPGGEYRAHFDAIPGFANQRILTFLVWLNEGYEGGETDFPTPGLRLKGRTGDAVLFRNAEADGRRDPAAGHAGLPVTSGEKLIASRWIRARRFEMPTTGRAG